jgi:beta-lactamase superfamily II metal-dependent hydrolase
MDGKVTSVKIRMYNTGSVGDCLLLIFEKKEGNSFNMLIDCGGFNTSSAFVTPCVEDIKKTCNGTLDLLVVTHQHEDHISGFNLARKVFDTIEVKESWMSWVEDSKDPIAAILKKKYGKKLKEVKKETEESLKELKLHSQYNSPVKGVKKAFDRKKLSITQTLGLIAFEEGLSHGNRLAAGSRTNEDAMGYVKGIGKQIKYRLPGEVIKDIKGAEGIKFYILGPPRDEDFKFLKIEEYDEELYHLAATATGTESAESPTERLFGSGISLIKNVSPFGDEYKMSESERKDFFKLYNSSNYKWRQIETDWLETGNEMAMALNRFTNNTSLAMALEFEDSGHVILLPADAQSGNWMSWHKPDVMKSLKKKGGKDTNELLDNTIFYKVGHHGSHNGTASKSGLNKVGDKNLVAFMPLVQDKVPDIWGGADNFPDGVLYKFLIEKTKGRLIRTDTGLVTDNNAGGLRNLLSSTDKNNFTKNLKKGSCYYEYTVKG